MSDLPENHVKVTTYLSDDFPAPAVKLVVTQCLKDYGVYGAWIAVGAFYDADDHIVWSTEEFVQLPDPLDYAEEESEENEPEEYSEEWEEEQEEEQEEEHEAEHEEDYSSSYEEEEEDWEEDSKSSAEDERVVQPYFGPGSAHSFAVEETRSPATHTFRANHDEAIENHRPWVETCELGHWLAEWNPVTNRWNASWHYRRNHSDFQPRPGQPQQPGGVQYRDPVVQTCSLGHWLAEWDPYSQEWKSSWYYRHR